MITGYFPEPGTAGLLGWYKEKEMSAVMNTRWSFLLRVSFLLAMLFSLSACAAGQKAADDVTIRIAVLPILDALPIYVADQNGLFQNHNVKVELIPAGQAPERDQLITAGQADGMMRRTQGLPAAGQTWR